MANVQLVGLPNDVLCFVYNKFGKVAVKLLKSILQDFYEVDGLSAAKLQLILNFTSKWTHFLQGCEGDSRLAREIDDILCLII